MTARKPAARQAAFADPDRPLLRLLNRAGGKPVLVMCGLPGNRDPAHAAAGRLPVRFHRFSDLRLYWHECRDGHPRPNQQQRFVTLILLTNAGKPFIDQRSAPALVKFGEHGKPVLWGEVSPEGVVTWRPLFRVARIIECGPELCLPASEFHLERSEPGSGFYMERDEFAPGWVREEGWYRWVCGSHYRLVPETA